MTESHENKSVRLTKPVHGQLQEAVRDGETNTGAVGRALDALETEQLAPEYVREQARKRSPGRERIGNPSDGLHSVAQALGDLGEATTGELASHDSVGIQRQQVRNHLHSLVESGLVERADRESSGVVWRDAGVDEIPAPGESETTTVRFAVGTYERLDAANRDYESFSDTVGRALDALEREDVVRELLAGGMEVDA